MSTHGDALKIGIQSKIVSASLYQGYALDIINKSIVKWLNGLVNIEEIDKHTSESIMFYYM